MCDLGKWYRRTYFQGRNKDADIENGHVGMGKMGEGDKLGDWDQHIHTTRCEIDS